MSPKSARKPRAQKHARRPPKTRKIRRSALEEYKESISQDGVLEVMSLEDDNCLSTVRGWVSTGSVELDLLLNGQGIPLGRVVEIIGPEHIGKSTLLDQIFANVQRMGGVAVLAEPEISRDRAYSTRLGVNTRDLQYLQFAREEFVLERIFSTFMRTIDWWAEHHPGTPVVIGLDALAGTATHSEMMAGVDVQEKKKKKGKSAQSAPKKDEGEDQPKETKTQKGGGQPGEAAKYLARVARQLPVRLGGTQISVVILNHEYSRVGMTGMGPKNESYGGKALRRMASIRLRLYPAGEWLEAGGRKVGRVVVARLEKNRLGNPWGEAYLPVVSGYGIDNCWSVCHGLERAGMTVKSGSWQSFNLAGEVYRFQGWTGFSALMAEHPELFPQLVGIYRERMLPLLTAVQAGPPSLTGASVTPPPVETPVPSVEQEKEEEDDPGSPETEPEKEG